MQTEAVFDNIAIRIQSEIRKAQKSVFIAVAWFTNKDLFDELIEKAKAGCKVLLIISIDKINTNSQIKFEQLEKYNSKCYKIGNGEKELMHNKFCVIDYSTVITGSYNWSYKAENNFENVIINYDDTALAEQFISEFNQIRKKFYPDEPKTEIIFPIGKIIKRLEILKNHIILEDLEELKKQTTKLSEYDFNTDLLEIINDIQNEEFVSAITKIQNFINQNQQLAIWDDPEIAALRLEVKILENQLNGYENEKIELEKLLSDFHHRHTIELGDIILEILKLRKLKYKEDKEKHQEAEEDYKQYNEQISEEKEKIKYDLTDEEKLELKKKFRKATFMCHPDKVGDEFKNAAQKIFVDLKAAYEANDLKKVTEILNNLENGNFFKSMSDTISEKDKLLSASAKLRMQIKTLESEITSIKQSETYKTISEIADGDAYFKKTRELLEQELQELKNEIQSTLSH
jgi:hypothetical protein